MELRRRNTGAITPKPRLQSVNVIVGSEPPGFHPYISITPGLFEVEELTFEILLSEHAEEAKLGIARVSCPELEALRAKYGADLPVNHWQEQLLKGMIARVERGRPFQAGTSLNSAKDLTRPLRMSTAVFDGDI